MKLPRRSVWLVTAVLAVAAFGALVVPGRMWNSQSDSLAEARAERDALVEQNRDLEIRVEYLGSPEVVERAARSTLTLGFDNEQVFSISTAPSMPVDLPEVWPFTELQAPLAEAAQRR